MAEDNLIKKGGKYKNDTFSRIIQQLKQWKEHKSKLGLKEKPRMALK